MKDDEAFKKELVNKLQGPLYVFCIGWIVFCFFFGISFLVKECGKMPDKPIVCVDSIERVEGSYSTKCSAGAIGEIIEKKETVGSGQYLKCTCPKEPKKEEPKKEEPKKEEPKKEEPKKEE